MANVNINEELHQELWERFKEANKIDFPSYKNMLERMLRHSLECSQFASRKNKPNTR